MNQPDWALRVVIGLTLTIVLVIGMGAYRGATNPPEFPASVVAE